MQPPPGNSWLGSLIATIIGNLKISISNVHVRFEDAFRSASPLFNSHPYFLLVPSISGFDPYDGGYLIDFLHDNYHYF